MSSVRQDSTKPDAEPRKKANETIQLSAEELKRINGGVNPPPPPVVNPNDIHSPKIH